MKTLFRKLTELRWVYVYILLIPIVNLSFVYVPVVPLADGGNWSPMAVVTGLVLVFRDFAQREIGHYIFIPLLIGVALSYVTAGPEIAMASGIAFFISEIADWAVYSLTKKPLSQRIMISSLVGAPIDTTIFLLGANHIVPGIFSLGTLVTSIVSKLLGAYVVYRLLKRRERRMAPSAS